MACQRRRRAKPENRVSHRCVFFQKRGAKVALRSSECSPTTQLCQRWRTYWRSGRSRCLRPGQRWRALRGRARGAAASRVERRRTLAAAALGRPRPSQRQFSRSAIGFRTGGPTDLVTYNRDSHHAAAAGKGVIATNCKGARPNVATKISFAFLRSNPWDVHKIHSKQRIHILDDGGCMPGQPRWQ